MSVDVLFLQLMVRHHEGALDMISEVLTEGSDQQLGKLAAGMASDQGSEIDRMNLEVREYLYLHPTEVVAAR